MYDETEITCVGYLTMIDEGEYIQGSGSYIHHPVYGEQFLMESCEIKEPKMPIPWSYTLVPELLRELVKP